MKNRFFISCCLASLVFISQAQERGNTQEKLGRKRELKDSVKHHKLNFNFIWFDVGGSIPVKEKKLRSLPYGLGAHMYNVKGNLTGSFVGLGLCYKDHWGLSVLFSFQEYSVPDGDYKNYISSQYPNYFSPAGTLDHVYSLDNINYRLSYRFHRGRFIYEPMLQLGINDYDEFETHFVLKEKGSNNFIEYDIRKENTRKNIFSYRLGFAARWRLTRPDWKWNVEPGIKLDVLLVPTNFNYTITSKPYNMPATAYEVNVKQLRPAILITTGISVFRK